MRAPASLLVVLCLTFVACVNQSPGGANAPAPPPSPNAVNPYQPTSYVKLKHPEWAKSAVIYQINTRQFTPEGTFRAAEAHLPRLKELGVDILWLMPIHKIGEKNRKGTLGSPYSVKDYYSVNPEFGTWEGTEFEAFGAGVEPAMVLSVVGEGMPLVYNGQEAGNARRLQFFEKDPIVWKEHPNGALYQRLFALKRRNTALWNGLWGATMILVPNSAPAEVFSFVRRNEADKVFAVINFSGRPQALTFRETLYHGKYTDYFGGEAVELDAATRLELKPWGYKVFVK